MLPCDDALRSTVVRSALVVESRMRDGETGLARRAQAKIRAGTPKRDPGIIQYLLSPIMKGTDEAGRER